MNYLLEDILENSGVGANYLSDEALIKSTKEKLKKAQDKDGVAVLQNVGLNYKEAHIATNNKLIKTLPNGKVKVLC